MGRYISLDPVILKETRERLGHTQESLAHAVGIRRETYTRIESAGSTQLVTAEKIAGQLEVDLGHLTGTKRQDTLSSPFACEWRYREATGDKHELLLFNTEWELLEFIESHIADERPALDDDLFPELSKKPVPDYSVAPDGTKAGLKLPRRGEKQGASHGFYQFTFRELNRPEFCGGRLV